MIKVKFNYHFIDEWTGETGFALVDGKLVWSEAHNWCSKVMPWYCKKYGINSCGNEYPDRISHPVEFVLDHTDSKIELLFSSTLDKAPCQASWGIDDV